MQRRRTEGDETWNRLKEWTRGQKASERLSAGVLKLEGYDVDPSHPLGGPDGKKDLICRKDDLTLVGACHFPRVGQKSQILSRSLRRTKGCKEMETMVCIGTNQELTWGEDKTKD